MGESEKSVKKKILKLSIIYLITFALLMGAYSLYVRSEIIDSKNIYKYIAKDKADHIATTVNNVLLRSGVMNALIQDHNGGTEFFDQLADDIFLTVKNDADIQLDYIAIAPNGIVSGVYPEGTHQDLIGYDYLDVTKPGNVRSRSEYDNGKTILTHYFDIINNGIGLSATTPIFINDGEERKFWGIVALSIDPKNFADALRFEPFTEMGIDYRLSYIDPHGTRHLIRESETPVHDEINYIFAVHNLNWELSINPHEGWYSYKNFIVIVIVCLCISALITLFANMLFKIRDANQELWKISNMDKLTECYNRRAYEEKLKDIASDEKMCSKLVYVAVDINGLKKANDNLGHEAGDELIKGAANCLKNCFKDYGNVFRTGGDEFVAIISCDSEKLEKCKETLDRSISKWKGELNISLSLSKGYAPHYEFPEMSIEELAKTADQRMYEDKRNFYIKSGQDRRGSR